MRSLCFLFFYIGLVFAQDESTGKIRVLMYNMGVMKENFTVPASTNKLADSLPKIAHDTLVIADQDLPEITTDFLEDLDLYTLVLDSNNIKKLTPGCFGAIKRITEISLKNNKIESIPRGVFNNINLTTLSLKNNLIDEIAPSAFDRMPYLINIDLSHNKIKQWNMEWFYNTPRLSRIEFSHNSLTKLPANAFMNLAGEKFLNELKLKLSLHFSYNNLKSIGLTALKGLKEIDSLWLDHNELESFNEELVTDIEVQDLRLDGNKIRRLSGDWKKILNVPLVSIDSNPFDCDFIKEVKEWSEEHKKTVRVFYSEMDCVVDRIKGKMDDLQKKIKALRDDRLRAEAEAGINPDAEIVDEDRIESLA